MRFVASGNFLFAIAAFFLPWIDVRCEMSKGESYGLFTQSGYQIASGESTEGDAKEKIEQKMKGLGMPANQKQAMPKQKEQEIDREKLDKIPVLWGFVGALGAGAILCLILPGTLWRVGAVIALVAALGVLGYQTNEGFPASKKVNEVQAVLDKAKQAEQQAPGGKNMNMKMPGFDFDPRYFVVYKPGFYLAWGLSALPLLWILIDAMIAKPKSAGRDPNDEYQNDRKRPFNDR